MNTIAVLMSMVDKVLVFLSDGTWHDVSEVASNLEIDHHRLDKVLKLLTEFDLIETDATRVRVDSDTKAFLKSITRNNGTERQ